MSPITENILRGIYAQLFEMTAHRDLTEKQKNRVYRAMRSVGLVLTDKPKGKAKE